MDKCNTVRQMDKYKQRQMDKYKQRQMDKYNTETNGQI